MEAFDFQNQSANKLFTTRFADQGLVGKLQRSQAISAFVDTFNGSWSKEVSRLEYSNGILYARFRHGGAGYVPANKVEPMLNDLVILAGVLEAL
jgi:hypothetical protein